ncbi:hypothetical protein LCGC14_3085890 [marine sediment metagenome]|uniref:Leucine-rich repeat domain-containing protein n=1 Tax=marine sediment metagenome TaxID=412755 RepID=A0A0F8X0I3_9ZZZZ
MEIYGEKFYFKDNVLDLNALGSSSYSMKKIWQLSSIKGLEKLKNLKVLILDMHQIAEIKGLDHLEDLEFLSFRNNSHITEIKGLEN